MLTYEQIENWWKERENKNKVVIAACFLVIFFVGFGTGRYERQSFRERSKQANYTTPPAKNPEILSAQAALAGQSTSSSSQDCAVKGNIAAGGKKIYHVKGGSFYNRTNAEQCFNTEAEAVAAGYVKSSR